MKQPSDSEVPRDPSIMNDPLETRADHRISLIRQQMLNPGLSTTQKEALARELQALQNLDNEH